MTMSDACEARGIWSGNYLNQAILARHVQTPIGATPPEPRSTLCITMQSDSTDCFFANSFGHNILALHIPVEVHVFRRGVVHLYLGSASV
jgi:hypothetical protein